MRTWWLFQKSLYVGLAGVICREGGESDERSKMKSCFKERERGASPLLEAFSAHNITTCEPTCLPTQHILILPELTFEGKFLFKSFPIYSWELILSYVCTLKLKVQRVGSGCDQMSECMCVLRNWGKWRTEYLFNFASLSLSSSSGKDSTQVPTKKWRKIPHPSPNSNMQGLTQLMLRLLASLHIMICLLSF